MNLLNHVATYVFCDVSLSNNWCEEDPPESAQCSRWYDLPRTPFRARHAAAQQTSRPAHTSTREKLPGADS